MATARRTDAGQAFARREDGDDVEGGAGPSSSSSGAGASAKGHHPRRPVSRSRAGLVALSYMACAILLIYFNKVALSTYRFHHPNLITLLQLVCALGLLAALCAWDVVSLYKDDLEGSRTRKRFPSLHEVRGVAPLSLAYLVYMVMGMASLKGVNLPMYTTLRRTTALFTLTAEYFLTGATQPRNIQGSVGLMVAGAVVAGLNDLSFDAWGYTLVFASNCSTALYLGIIARLGKRSSLNSFGLMWCNGLVCVPILLVWTVLNGEVAAALAFPPLHSGMFQVVLLFSCVLAFMLNYTIFLNTAVNSALTQTVCGNLKDVVVIIIGFHSFPDAAYDPVNLGGILLGLIGSVSYAVAKLS